MLEFAAAIDQSAPPPTLTSSRPCRVWQHHTIDEKQFVLREAACEDAPAIRALFEFVYNGKYPDAELQHLAEDLLVPAQHLCVIATFAERIVGCLMLSADLGQRIGRANRVLVLPEYRKVGLALSMLRLAIDYWCVESAQLDVVYGTSRTVSSAPAKISADAGMLQMGVFPNAVQIDSMEHLNLEVFFAADALQKRRAPTVILPAFQRIYNLAMRQLGHSETAALSDLPKLPLSRRSMPLSMNHDSVEVAALFSLYRRERRLAHDFFPFHEPNTMLSSADGSTEVFIWYEGTGKRAAIIGYRSERKNTHELLRAVAMAMENYGAAYLEILVQASDPVAQQCAHAARFLPCAYFPALRLERDGSREDYFVLSRTFRLLDFNDVVISPQNVDFLRAYLAGYYQLYIEPLLGPMCSNLSDLEKAE